MRMVNVVPAMKVALYKAPAKDIQAISDYFDAVEAELASSHPGYIGESGAESKLHGEARLLAAKAERIFSGTSNSRVRLWVGVVFAVLTLALAFVMFFTHGCITSAGVTLASAGAFLAGRKETSE